MKADYAIKKYPRTPHLQGSRLQVEDEDLSQRRFAEIDGKHVVLEEKIDGANCAVSFNESGELLLQSRGHYLTGGQRERHYNLLKQWGAVQKEVLHAVLGDRYIMYGEWMYAKHSVFYDRLPHYFMEFDVFDRERGIFLDTPSRRNLLKNLPICSVPVLAEGIFQSRDEILNYLGDSKYISENHTANLRAEATRLGLNADRIVRETDSSRMMEGIYIKVEENGEVTDRMKYVRNTFLQTESTPQGNWLDRPIIPNILSRPLTELFI